MPARSHPGGSGGRSAAARELIVRETARITAASGVEQLALPADYEDYQRYELVVAADSNVVTVLQGTTASLAAQTDADGTRLGVLDEAESGTRHWLTWTPSSRTFGRDAQGATAPNARIQSCRLFDGGDVGPVGPRGPVGPMGDAVSFHAVTHEGATTLDPVEAEADVDQVGLWYVVAAAGLSGALAGHANELVRKDEEGDFEFEMPQDGVPFFLISDTLDPDDDQGFIGRLIWMGGVPRPLVEGFNNTASGQLAHVEGGGNTASGDQSHAEGEDNVASGESAHVEGAFSVASGDFSHAEGYNGVASGRAAHAEGEENIAAGRASHAEGFENAVRTHAASIIGQRGVVAHPQTLLGIAHGAAKPSDDERAGVADRNLVARVKRDGTIVATGFRRAADPASSDGVAIDGSDDPPDTFRTLPVLELVAAAQPSSGEVAGDLDIGDNIPRRAEPPLPVRFAAGADSSSDAATFFELEDPPTTVKVLESGRTRVSGALVAAEPPSNGSRARVLVECRRTRGAQTDDFVIGAAYGRNDSGKTVVTFDGSVPVQEDDTLAIRLSCPDGAAVYIALESLRAVFTFEGVIETRQTPRVRLALDATSFAEITEEAEAAGGAWYCLIFTPFANWSQSDVLAWTEAGWYRVGVSALDAVVDYTEVASQAQLDAIDTATGQVEFVEITATFGSWITGDRLVWVTTLNAWRKVSEAAIAQAPQAPGGSGGTEGTGSQRALVQSLYAYGQFQDADLTDGLPPDAPFAVNENGYYLTTGLGGPWFTQPEVGAPPASFGDHPYWRTVGRALPQYSAEGVLTGYTVSPAQVKSRINQAGAVLYSLIGDGDVSPSDAPPAGWDSRRHYHAFRTPDGNLGPWLRSGTYEVATRLMNISTSFRGRSVIPVHADAGGSFRLSEFSKLRFRFQNYSAGYAEATDLGYAEALTQDLLSGWINNVDHSDNAVYEDFRVLRVCIGGGSNVSAVFLKVSTPLSASQTWPSRGCIIDIAFNTQGLPPPYPDLVTAFRLMPNGQPGIGNFQIWGLP